MAEKAISFQEKIPYQGWSFELTNSDDDDLPIYLTGNFNNWNAKDETFRFQKIASGKFLLKVNLPFREIEYKYTRGSWDTVELDRYGNEVKNRKVNTDKPLVQDEVFSWKKRGLAYNPSFLPSIRILSEKFEIPQLIKTRRIAALLPYNYDETDRRYPVLYLQDGQNLFDDYAPFGNWGLDKKLAVLAAQGMGDIIVIAIDHAAEERIVEFTPSITTRLGKGDGKKYVRFLTDTLKPHVDKHFRTLPEREHTSIGGSSMGGLISIYAGLLYPEVYGKLLIFSPSLWVAPNIHFQIMHFYEPFDMKVYIYGGENEGMYMIPNIKRFISAIEQQGIASNIDFHLSIDPQGKHNEARWGEEFPKAIEWLFFTNASQKTSMI